MRDTLTLIGAVLTAITALTMFVLASDDVTKRQQAIVAEWQAKNPDQKPDRSAALKQARNERKWKRRIFVVVPAVATAVINFAALAVGPAEPHGDHRPPSHSSPAVTSPPTAR